MPRARPDKGLEEKKRPSFRMRLLFWCLNLVALLIAAVLTYVMIIFLQMPSLDAILHETRPAAIVFLDKNGTEIRSSNRIMGMPVSTDTVPLCMAGDCRHRRQAFF